MMDIRRAITSAVAVAVLAMSVPAQGQSETKQSIEEARDRFHRGLQLYEEDNFRAALVEFQRAYELAPSYRILFNIGQVQFQLQDYAGALRSFELHLQQGADGIDPERRRQVQVDIERLRARVAQLQVTTSEPGVEIFVDDVLVGKTPLSSPVIVSAGRRTISARLTGHRPVLRVVDLAGSDAKTLNLKMVRSESDSPPVAEAVPPPSRQPQSLPPHSSSPDSSHVPWSGWAITGVLAAGATVTGVLALRASSDLQEQRETPDVGRSTLDDAEVKVRRYAIVTDVLGAGALVVGGISLYLTLDREPERDEPSAASVRVQPGLGSFLVSGSF